MRCRSQLWNRRGGHVQQFLSALLLLANPAAEDQPQAALRRKRRQRHRLRHRTRNTGGARSRSTSRGSPSSSNRRRESHGGICRRGADEGGCEQIGCGATCIQAGESRSGDGSDAIHGARKSLSEEGALTIPIRMETGENGMSELSSFLLGYLQRPAAEGETLSHIFAEFLTAAAARQPRDWRPRFSEGEGAHWGDP